jgi:hypothetical protein
MFSDDSSVSNVSSLSGASGTSSKSKRISKKGHLAGIRQKHVARKKSTFHHLNARD